MLLSSIRKSSNRKLKGILGILIVMVMNSCTGGLVTRNGFFEDKHESLKGALVGEWRIYESDMDFIGPAKYSFYKDTKGNFKLQVDGFDTDMERFDSPDGNSFIFHYQDSLGKSNFVYGHFRSYARNQLMLYEGSDNNSDDNNEVKQLEASISPLKSFKTLNKVVAEVSKSSN